jgi:uncharacterized membrane protein YciS (DUF1049 family)
MSLKIVHIVFVVSAIALSLGVGAQQLVAFHGGGGNGALVSGLFWVAAGITLMVYGRRVVRKLRQLSLR